MFHSKGRLFRFIKNMKGFKCVHLNVRSLYPKISEVQQQFAGFDVIIITESWLNQTIPIGVINMPGYTVIRQDRDKFINKQEEGYVAL